MDLVAFANIDNLNHLLVKNKIEIPRLRGIRYMKEEIPIMEEDYKEGEEFIKRRIYEDAIHACPIWNLNSGCSEYSNWKTYLEKYFGVFRDKQLVDLQWKKINRKKRKAIKMAIKKQLSAYKKQIETFNKYVGRDDVVYIHHLATDINYKGLGSHMLNQIKEIALKEGKKSIRLDNINTNEKLNEYYEKNGFKQIGVIEAKQYDGQNFGILREYKIV